MNRVGFLCAVVCGAVLSGCGKGGSETKQAEARCIEQAKAQGYRSGQCAYTFIDTCIQTQSRSAMESVLRADAALGTGSALTCPNMPSTYAAAFDRF